MNILITGASRGIGAATYSLLKTEGHRVIGHSTKGSDDLIAGDLADSSAPRDIWDTALAELDGQIDGLINNAGIYEAVPDNATDDEWHAAWQRTLAINLQAAADLSKLAGPVRASWFDPRTGEVTAAGEHENAGKVEFTPPTGAGGEATDWVLMLDVASKGYSLPGE